jgi:hypothetical protein
MRRGWTIGLAAVGLLLVMVLAVYALGRTRPSPDCTTSVVIARGAHGQQVECVCVDGVIATCFQPGP